MKKLILAISIVLFFSAPVLAQGDATVISNDHGGIIIYYIAKYKQLKAERTPVVLSGYCNSACTLVLMLPRSQVCAQPGAVLGFHAGATLDKLGTINKEATSLMTRYYPPSVRKWFYSKKLSLAVRYRRATDFFPPCRG